MKSTGIVRRIDELGRIVLPIEIRNTLDIKNRDALEIFINESQIILQKYEPSCIFCGSEKEVTYFKGKLICKACIETLSKSAE